MIKQDLFERPQFLTVADLSKIFDCGTSSAQRIMRNIKSVSDITGMKGKITVSDYEAWFSGKQG